ncbi:hypothetical protein TanjilG_18725 [Lupinus angustifolius]|uniref:Uncharacterized protein n=1 Tax=Lupinus angustifolius TaxID=3871 RepID=A0A1J7GCQ7_LUPAN|nr:PREDICTED: uncharacterized protein LOC109334100 [Lupinus angustifolius]OIV92153.1 hypothetical protein TanjilG_18725 [Lupinus angustifolius]
MKLYRKPISSPVRTDKFPPPLMRFWRSNVGNGSRGRSRSNSSTMFVRKRNTNIEATQEPTSPKVTCMGQVKVKRSSKSKEQKISTRAAAKDGAPVQFRWFWIPKNAFQIKPCHCKPTWPKWGFIFKVGSFRRKSRKMKEGSEKTELETEHEGEYDESERVMNGDDGSSFASNSGTPPRNALSLTRCRSAPYRSSSLGSRFLGSPLRNEEETEKKQGNEVENGGSNYSENEIPHLERNSVSDEEENRVSENEEKLEFFNEIEDSVRDRFASMKNISENVDALKKREKEEGDCEVPHPVVLTRCKSDSGLKLILR